MGSTMGSTVARVQKRQRKSKAKQSGAMSSALSFWKIAENERKRLLFVGGSGIMQGGSFGVCGKRMRLGILILGIGAIRQERLRKIVCIL